jgi:hypothetical protein
LHIQLGWSRSQRDWIITLPDPEGHKETWVPVKVPPEVGAIFACLRVRDVAETIQFRANGANLSCESLSTPVRMFIQMESLS